MIAFFAYVPFFAYAQTVDVQALLAKIQALQSQLANMQGSSNFCDLPTHTLRRGSSGDDVSRLQQFLARDTSVYPEASITGYYGALTELAVQRWQIKNGIVLSGTAATTGFGAVGPKTLAAMRTVWCLPASTTAAPFILPKDVTLTNSSAQTQSATATTTAPVQQSAQIVVTAPVASTSIQKGSILVTSWKSTNAPLGATVSVSLSTPFGTKLGILRSGLNSTGTYYWTIPAANTSSTGGACDGSAIDCISQLAGATGDCTTLCSITEGLYVIYAQLVHGGKELAHAQSASFWIGTPSASNAGTLNFGGSGTSSYSSSFVQNNSWTSTEMSTLPQSCLYSGVPYSDGIALEITCADVRIPGQGCGTFGGMKLTCKNGVWVDGKGVAQSVRNVTTTNTAGSCTTPWGSMIVSNGNQVPYEPFFSSGLYSGAMMVKLMRCSSGKWQTCDTVGDNCR